MTVASLWRTGTNPTPRAQRAIRRLCSVALSSSSPSTQVNTIILTTENISNKTNAGDPTTPGYPAYENATRTEGENIPKIPSLPISWANAQRLLSEISHDHDARSLTGQVSETKVHLVNHGMYAYEDGLGTNLILTNSSSRHQGHAHLEYHGCHPWSHQE